MAGRWLCAAILAVVVAASVPDAAQAAFTCQDREFVLDSLANGRAVTAEFNYKGAVSEMLRARATAHDAWERYRMVCLDSGQFAIVALNTGLYVSTETGYAEKDTGMLRARATAIGPTERYVFEQTSQEGDFVRGSLKSVANNKYVTVELGYDTTDARYGMLRARAAISDRWEALEIAWQPIPPAPGPVDADGDGFSVGQDCDDTNPAIRPGAPEVRGNGIDENCDGRDDELLRIVAGVSSQFRVLGTHFTIRKLRVTEVLAGETVELRCTGRHCPVKRLKFGSPHRGVVNTLGKLGKRRARFRSGQTLEVWITAPGQIGKVVRYRLRRGTPDPQPLCVLPQSTHPQRCTGGFARAMIGG